MKRRSWLCLLEEDEVLWIAPHTLLSMNFLFGATLTLTNRSSIAHAQLLLI
jgi:hypothetical protein